VAVGSSLRFKVVDFGFGRPERVRSGGNKKIDVMVYLYPGHGGSNIHLALQLEPMYRVDWWGRTFTSSWTRRQPTA